MQPGCLQRAVYTSLGPSLSRLTLFACSSALMIRIRSSGLMDAIQSARKSGSCRLHSGRLGEVHVELLALDKLLAGGPVQAPELDHPARRRPEERDRKCTR